MRDQAQPGNVWFFFAELGWIREIRDTLRRLLKNAGVLELDIIPKNMAKNMVFNKVWCFTIEKSSRG